MHATKEKITHIKTLTKRDDFVLAAKQGQKWVSQSLILQARPNDDGQIRIGYTVTKRTEKSAVKRNRIKRRLRAIASDILSVNALDGYDYVLIGRSETATRPYLTLCKDLKWCLKKLELLKEK